jgi:hypothetical protein
VNTTKDEEKMGASPKSRAPWFVWTGRIASAVCLAGMVWAGILLFSPGDECPDLSSARCAANDPEISRREEFELEKIGGKAMVYAVRLNHWLASWFAGIKLALLISALSLLTAVVCYREARWLKEQEEDKATAEK